LHVHHHAKSLSAVNNFLLLARVYFSDMVTLNMDWCLFKL